MLGRATTWIALFTVLVGVATLFGISQPVYADTVANFGSDPGWDGNGNRDGSQDFGWSNTNNAGGSAAGEIGGDVVRGPNLAWYAQEITPIAAAATSFSASGKLILSGSGNFLVGWFDSTKAASGGLGWSPDNFVGFRSDDHSLYAYADGGGGSFASGVTAGGSGATTFNVSYDHTSGDLTATSGQGGSETRNIGSDGPANLANLDRFGILNLHNGGDAMGTMWVDDLTFTGIVPEPTSVVLMMLGLGLASFSRRRR
jgi:hypothetical protein